jgi:hypothetical protein
MHDARQGQRRQRTVSSGGFGQCSAHAVITATGIRLRGWSGLPARLRGFGTNAFGRAYRDRRRGACAQRHGGFAPQTRRSLDAKMGSVD